MLPIEGNGQLERAVRMMQMKVRHLDEEMAGEYDHPMDTEEDIACNERGPTPTVATAATVARKEETRYYYVMRGPYNAKTKAFFSGYVKTAEEYAKKQAGTWKFVGNLSTDAKKLMEWILHNEDKVNKETASWFNERGEFSKKWYTILHPDGMYWIVASPQEAAAIKAERPELKTAQPKAHSSYKDAADYVHTNAEIYCTLGMTLT